MSDKIPIDEATVKQIAEDFALRHFRTPERAYRHGQAYAGVFVNSIAEICEFEQGGWPMHLAARDVPRFLRHLLHADKEAFDFATRGETPPW